MRSCIAARSAVDETAGQLPAAKELVQLSVRPTSAASVDVQLKLLA